MEKESNLSCPYLTNFQVASQYFLPIPLHHVFSTWTSNNLSIPMHMYRYMYDLIAHSLWRGFVVQKLFGIDFHTKDQWRLLLGIPPSLSHQLGLYKLLEKMLFATQLLS